MSSLQRRFIVSGAAKLLIKSTNKIYNVLIVNVVCPIASPDVLANESDVYNKRKV